MTQHVSTGSDEGSDNDFEELPRQHHEPSETSIEASSVSEDAAAPTLKLSEFYRNRPHGDAESFVSGDLGDWQDRLRDEPTQHASASVPYLGVSRSPSDASSPRGTQHRGVSDDEAVGDPPRMQPPPSPKLETDDKYEYVVQQTWMSSGNISS